jgi:C4-dicarboxylate transporter DctQ subunit
LVCGASSYLRTGSETLLLLRILDHLEETLIALLMAAATVIIFCTVVQRYAVGVPALYPYARDLDLTWAQELCIYMFVWMAKFGAAYGVRTGIHVGVDVFINMLGVERRHKVILFGLLCGALFTGIIGSLGAYLVWHIGQIGQVSQDLEVPMWLVYLCVPLGSYLMCFRFLQVAWVFQHNGELPSHDHAEVAGLADEGKPAETPT